MIGLDSNILLRFVLQDDERQFAMANDVIASCSSKQPGYVNLVVLCEVVWFLTKQAKLDRVFVAEIFAGLLQTTDLKFERPDIVARALEDVRVLGSGFADRIIALINLEDGCVHTVTFDRKAGRTVGFRPVDPAQTSS